MTTVFSRRTVIAAGAGAALIAGLPLQAQEMPYSTGNGKPAFKAPPGTCDAHFHVYDSRFPAAPNASLVPPDASLADYAKLRERLGFQRSVIVQPSTYGTDNSLLLQAMGELGDAARGVAVVDTSVTDEELQRLDEAGIRGIRFNLGRAGATTVEMIVPLADRVQSLGWHVQVHMKADDIAKNAALLRSLPVTVVIDHLGRLPMPGGMSHPAFAVVRDMLAEGRAYTKLSSIYQDSVVSAPGYPDIAEVARAYIGAAPDRVLWATDWPHPSPGPSGLKPDDARLMDLAAEWAGDDATRQKIFVDNAATLYGF
jgi:predicted TIM-barrel fold metal-dependent hydrolase